MEVNHFYSQFITADALEKICREQGRNYHSVDEFTLYRKRDMENPYFLSWAVEELSAEETELLNHLKSLPSKEGYYTVPYDLNSYPFLIKYWLLIEAGNGRGVILESTVRNLVKELNKNNQLMDWSDSIGPVKREILLSYAELPIEELLRSVRINQLKDISKALSYVPSALHKEAFVKGASESLTNTSVVARLLIQLSDENYQLIKIHAENDIPLYNGADLNEDLFNSGLVIRLENSFGVTPYEVLKTIRETNFTEIEARRRSKMRETGSKYLEEGYNALRIKVTLVGTIEPIYREILIPTRLNFYEFHIIIQNVFGWESKAPAKFIMNDHEVRVYSSDDVVTSKQLLEASMTQVDMFLTTEGEITYLYDYNSEWKHRVELMGYAAVEESIPEVVEYSGPIVIEGLGSITEFEEKYEILKDKNHPQFTDTFTWAKKTNYKGRYPKNAINRTLRRIFSKGYAITEKNDMLFNAQINH
ncbi:plasmid pRiA4b ORF-3 family protein [Corticicoccus populi]|uniref:Plasmid pRiA4b ORF-3 family protein n=1 Tax=Corticicoccus populi TaxID=1812821 RepID=A0ABW5WVY7_9STAP